MNRKKKNQQIINAAVELFFEKGFEKTSVSNIIQKAQIARGTYYLYYKNKEELLGDLLQQFFKRVAYCVDQIRPPKNLDCSAAVAIIAQQSQGLVQTFVLYQKLIALFLKRPHHLPLDFFARFQQFKKELCASLEYRLEAWTNDNQPSFYAHQTSLFLIGSVQEMVAVWLEISDSNQNQPYLSKAISLLASPFFQLQNAKESLQTFEHPDSLASFSESTPQN